MRGRTNKIFRVAVAGSLAVHAVIAAVVHSHPIEAAPEPVRTPARIIHITLPKPTPTPVPPKPHMQPSHARASSVRHRPALHLVHFDHTTKGATNVYVAPSAPPGVPEPPSDATPGPVATQIAATPQPTATPKPACSAPDVPARAIDALTPPAPPDAQGAQGEVKVQVDLDAQGNVTGAATYSSSGNQMLDMAAVRAARASRYAPEERNCKNVPGSYLFTVDFQE